MLDKEYFLTSGEKTQSGINVKKLASCIEADDTKETIKQIMYIMAHKIPLVSNSQSNEKFKRSAEQIIINRNRNGCCDSSTLFVSLCREKGIPAVQIITAKMSALRKGDFSRGHFFSGYFIKESNNWEIIDSNVDKKDLNKGFKIFDYDPNSEFISEDYYIFAHVRDFSDFEINGIKIDSIKAMNKIHRIIYDEYINKNIYIDRN